MSARILAVVNQKGGVAKSTLICNLAYAAVEAGLRTLLVDLDKQGSFSLAFPRVDGAAPGLVASTLFDATLSSAAPEVLGERLSIIRADKEKLSLLMGGALEIIKRPAMHLNRFADQFDLILIDTPGSIGMNPPMTVGALVAADAVVCPFSVGLFEADALSDLYGYISSIKSQGHNPRLRLLGLLPSRVNTKSAEEMAAVADLRKQLGAAILPFVLAERAAVKQASLRRRPVWKSTKGSGHLKAAREWREACEGVLGKLGEVKK